MIDYNPKEWFRYIFYFQKADTVRKLAPMILTMAAYSSVVAYIIIIHLKITENNDLKNISLMHSLLGFVISMLLVFRTNTAYDRWWEGRKLWGQLLNISRNLSMKMNSMLPIDDEKNRQFFIFIIPRFAEELKNHLLMEETRLSLDSAPHPEIPDFDHTKHRPNQVACLIMNRIHILHKQGTINAEQLLILNNEITAFLDICGACERIKNTPIPYSYSSFIKKFIFFYIITLPVGYVFNLGYWVVPVVVFVFYVLASLEIIAEEVEDPFGNDTNDLPLQRIAEKIRDNVKEILG